MAVTAAAPSPRAWLLKCVSSLDRTNFLVPVAAPDRCFGPLLPFYSLSNPAERGPDTLPRTRASAATLQLVRVLLSHRPEHHNLQPEPLAGPCLKGQPLPHAGTRLRLRW